jgi:predicted methyltransferase
MMTNDYPLRDSGRGRASARTRILYATAIVAGAAAVAIGAARAWQGRDLREEMPHVERLLQLGPGKTVADVGAGDGDWSRELSAIVGREGRVFATEVDPDRARKLEDLGKELGNVTAIRGSQTSTGLPESCCDAVLLRNVYHHFTDPGAMGADLLRALRPGGRIAVIDFVPDGDAPSGVPKNRGGHGVRPEQVIDEMTAAGFTLVERAGDWPGGGRNFCVVMRKPAE